MRRVTIINPHASHAAAPVAIAGHFVGTRTVLIRPTAPHCSRRSHRHVATITTVTAVVAVVITVIIAPLTILVVVFFCIITIVVAIAAHGVASVTAGCRPSVIVVVVVITA